MNYYEILNIKQNATKQDIKNAYRNLAKLYHPDVNPNTEKEFKIINQAYEILSNDDKKEEYDKSLSNKNVKIFYTITLEEAYLGKHATINYVYGNENKFVDVFIPSGIENNTVITLENFHKLLITIKIKDHSYINRVENDLYTILNISAINLIIGCVYSLEFLDSSILDINIPEGTQHNSVFKFSEKGMNKNGSLYIKIKSFIPRKLTDKQKDLLKIITNDPYY